MRNKWLPFQRDVDGAELRVFAFPYAGGGAGSFRPLRQHMPASIALCPVQLPGREGRLGEAAVTRLDVLGDMLVDGLGDFLQEPYALLGYSMGAIVALEFAHSIRKHGLPPPTHLVPCARGGPATRPRWSQEDSPTDRELVSRLVELGGTASEVIENHELLDLILPVLRADYVLNSSYMAHDQPLHCPVTAIGGLADSAISRDALRDWATVSVGPWREKMLRGGHFFMQERPAEFAAAVAQALTSVNELTHANAMLCLE